MLLSKMKKLSLAAVALSAALVASSSLALTVEKNISVKYNPYFGLDHQLNRMKFNKGYGCKCFHKTHLQLNLYAGVKFNECIGIEGGYVATESKNKYAVLYGGETSLGSRVPNYLAPIKFISHIKLKGYHLSMMNFYSPCGLSKLRLIGGIGAAFLQADAQRSTVLLDNYKLSGSTKYFKNKKAILRLMAASEYKFDEYLGIRATFCFLQTHKMVIRSQPQPGSPTAIIRPKDSFIYGLGLFFEI